MFSQLIITEIFAFFHILVYYIQIFSDSGKCSITGGSRICFFADFHLFLLRGYHVATTFCILFLRRNIHSGTEGEGVYRCN